ncbi:TPA: ATP-binding protein [Salmonella enterica subsp. houtenae serovar 47:z36:-]|nr:ATP-binding protein [Salmonella enterica]HCM1976366.1 ATP-binding protein [Salmonella enterica subsp. houtenae serovar 47:z36:-]
MRHFIETIFFKKNDEPYTLNLNGKNLIISGDNGSGKTRLIENIYEFIEKSINSHDPYTKEQLQKELNSRQKNLQYSSRGDGNYSYLNSEIERLTEGLKEFENFDITFNDVVDFRVAAKEKKSIIRLFPAIREAKIKNDGKISSLDLLLNEYRTAQKNNSKIDAGMYFERYIVTLWNYALVSKGVGNDDDHKRALGIIESINCDLKELFEDDSIKMDFDLDKLKIYLLQDNKEPFGLDKLSSGFSSILSIYTDLLIKAELDKISKHDMAGIVLIDEIDAHLHVTLQKKVFSFFSSSFPQIQFIVSTHSPFVIQSVSDAIIFNLSTLDQMGDLSLYSYTAIIQGLLGEGVSSDKLNALVKELMTLVENNVFDDKFHSIIKTLEKSIDFLDKSSKAAFMVAKSKYLDYSEREDDV